MGRSRQACDGRKSLERQILGRVALPDLGPPLLLTIKLEMDPALTAARLQYVDACNTPHELHIGSELESMLLEGAHQTFKTVYSRPGGISAATTRRA